MTLAIDFPAIQPAPRKPRSLHAWPLEADVAGVDEAGCGPLAGPVVVAAVILHPARRIRGLADSKVLAEKQRERLYARIVERAIAWSVVSIDVEEIDRVNIFWARMNGMTRALTALACAPRAALIDGNHLPRALSCDARAIVDGDAFVPAISAASILAKVTRDRLMRELDVFWPGYGFARHKGYSVPEHLDALRRLGPCPLHRRSFAPVREAMGIGQTVFPSVVP
ncbi:MAG: ribonuclease HII [Pseudomonadota bacterium]|nr:ribonuclease HII [Pseudomonadota bacterium]